MPAIWVDLIIVLLPRSPHRSGLRGRADVGHKWGGAKDDSGELGHTTHSNPSTGTRNSGTQGWKCEYWDRAARVRAAHTTPPLSGAAGLMVMVFGALVRTWTQKRNVL
ncbi:hypothetical protein AMECASPLE_006361 [Ameca splendens]|uniref:Uncharacterized protein n=1 Tax=Ameca splendens TaxID=208324 RepID=A0ABV0ZKI5_9TELE